MQPSETTMLSYLWIGANEVDASVAFYDSLLLPLGDEETVRNR